MKFYQTPHFRALEKEWKKKLEQEGFRDQEDGHENLRNHDTRTIAFQNREAISSFYTALGHFLSQERLPRRDRRILELYRQGEWIKSICERVQASDSTVRNTIRHYRKKLLGQ